jgi:hypothetical protein
MPGKRAIKMQDVDVFYSRTTQRPRKLGPQTLYLTVS